MPGQPDYTACMVREAPLHHYRICPRCKKDVSSSQRFCPSCYLWLARARQEPLRPLQLETDGWRDWVDRVWFPTRVFQFFLHHVILGIVVGIILATTLVVYILTLLPNWNIFGPRTHQRACYANMRVIQTSIEQYVMEQRFSPALASDPVKVLYEVGILSNKPQCPIAGNVYKIPRGSSLQCVGSAGHGLP
ncbi:MAG TPA: zinc ribbon domain-containing protein [Candidatus Ozemobacteraceae bacterium]|nr:zinc ribbon domain-containing protein [Candidatus Ozemobacteraceae bacterium]